VLLPPKPVKRIDQIYFEVNKTPAVGSILTKKQPELLYLEQKPAPSITVVCIIGCTSSYHLLKFAVKRENEFLIFVFIIFYFKLCF
jgi:hypothetical protein